MGYSKQQLSTIKRVVLPKEKFVIWHPYLPITATFFYPQGCGCGEVRPYIIHAAYYIFNKLWWGAPSRLMEVCQQALLMWPDRGVCSFVDYMLIMIDVIYCTNSNGKPHTSLRFIRFLSLWMFSAAYQKSLKAWKCSGKKLFINFS